MLGTAASQLARNVDSSLLWIVAVCVALFVFVVSLMIVFVIRFRRSRVTRTRHIPGHLALEVVWTVVPVVIVMGMFWFGYRDFLALRTPPADSMDVSVHAQRWYWSFEYPDRHVTSPELVVPRGRPVRLTITSAPDEVIHSFYVPAFRIKEDAVPGMETFTWLNADTPGEYSVFCAEFCGDEHSRMISKVRVVEPEAFERWMEEQVRGLGEPVAAAEAADADDEELTGQDGRALFATYCKACHGAEGRGGGPYGARNLASLPGWKRGTKRSDILMTLSEGLPGTMMRPFRYLPVRDRVALMRRVVSLAPGPRPEPEPDDLARLAARFPEFDPARRDQVRLTPQMPIEAAMEAVVRERQPGVGGSGAAP